MNQIISIIGKTNVGKSTLFNCLTKKNNSRTNNIPYFTRDRKYGILKIKNKNINLIDTAAILNDFFSYKKNNINYSINKQTRIAIQESKIILFLINSYTKIDLFYKKFINYLKLKNKKIIFIINKIDYFNKYIITDFYKFNLNHPIFISALKKINIKKLLFNIKKNLYNYRISIKNNKNLIKICTIGKTNVGKSTLINSLLKETRLIIDKNPGTTRENIKIKINYKNNLFILTDTEGIDKNIKKNKILKLINIYNIILYIIDANIGLVEIDLYLIKKIFLLGKFLILIINKWDLLNIHKKKLIKNELNLKLKKYKTFLSLHFISALYLYNIKTIFNSIEYFIYLKNKIWSIKKLTNLINLAIKKKPPLIYKNKKIKFILAKQINQTPINIIIFGNKKIKCLSKNYKKYLLNFFIKKLNIKNILLKITLL
ncbi:ribosome biogenesis GTPase Der [Candidatus Portiera aleyrodidarum]|uniref:GTPase Der n=1 Tax=Candidatus Portiera aleyrodidarum TaxID=91844 RepID=A0A8D9JVI7_9GAMM|nr:ribosome biogenesis GTPase Der [Candidatus Portiera aleyrodidarum]CEI58761.1 GTPase Der [Candidatus Portiera aleyrodidarum]